MTSRTVSIPKYRKQKNPSGNRAFVELNGRRIYLGVFGSPTSRAEYHRIVSEWEAAGRCIRVEAADLSIVELCARSLAYADGYCVGPDGTPTNEPHNFRLAIRPLKELYGPADAVQFGPLALKAVRERMIQLGWVRSQVNKHICRIKRMFRWATENEILPASAYHALEEVLAAQAAESKEGKRRCFGRIDARERKRACTTRRRRSTAHRAVLAGFVQLGESDLRPLRTREERSTAPSRLVHQKRDNLQRCDHRCASLVPGMGFDRVLETYGCYETPGSFESHAARLPESRRASRPKKGKSRAKRSHLA